MCRLRIRSNVKYIRPQFILFPWWNKFDFKKTWGPLLTRHVPIKNRAHYCVILYILRMDAVCIQSIAWNTQIGLGPFLSQRWNVYLSFIRQVPKLVHNAMAFAHILPYHNFPLILYILQANWQYFLKSNFQELCAIYRDSALSTFWENVTEKLSWLAVTSFLRRKSVHRQAAREY